MRELRSVTRDESRYATASRDPLTIGRIGEHNPRYSLGVSCAGRVTRRTEALDRGLFKRDERIDLRCGSVPPSSLERGGGAISTKQESLSP